VFRKWLEATTADALARKASKAFAKQDWNQGLILQVLGLPPSLLKVINTGSFATIYQHPKDPSKVIKVTSDKTDARRLIKAQQLRSPNIVKIHEKTYLFPTQEDSGKLCQSFSKFCFGKRERDKKRRSRAPSSTGIC